MNKDQQTNEPINYVGGNNLSFNQIPPLYIPKNDRLSINDIKNTGRFSLYLSRVFGISIPDFIVKDLATANEGIDIDKVIFAFSVFCERAAVLCNKSINYYNLLLDNLSVSNDIILPSINGYDDIRCKYMLKYDDNTKSYLIKCYTEFDVLPIVRGELFADPEIRIENEEGDIIDYIIVPDNILITMISVAIRNIAFPGSNNTCLEFTEPESEPKNNDSKPEGISLKYLTMLWKKGINIKLVGKYLIVISHEDKDESIIKSIDELFNSYFSFNNRYDLAEFIDELENSAIDRANDKDIIDKYSSQSDVDTVNCLCNNIVNNGIKIDIYKGEGKKSFIYTIMDTNGGFIIYNNKSIKTRIVEDYAYNAQSWQITAAFVLLKESNS